MKTVPEEVTNLIPYAYSWGNPEFAFIELGLVYYKTGAQSNAGGSWHSISFPVNIVGRTLSAEESWQNLADDAIQAVRDKTFRYGGFTCGH